MGKNISYIFVDLDGTLIKTDLFVESIIKLIKNNPFNLIRILLWVLQGRSIAKDKVASIVEIDVELLPYETELLDYLKKENATGKRLVLATASHYKYAQQVAEYLGIFDQVIASCKEVNLKGVNKLKEIKKIVGDEEFIYAGDSYADQHIWKEAAGNIFVNAPHKLIKEAGSQGKQIKTFFSRGSIARTFLKQMRLHQWAKNMLVFVPLFTSHSYQSPALIITALVSFLCFSLCASGVYCLNDLFDLESDRKHHRKRFRPLASGDLPLFWGVAGTIFLPVIAFVVAFVFIPIEFFLVLAFYFLITNLYSFFLKRVSTADVMTLAVLYTLRIVAGAVAIDVELSSWLMAFSVFVFVSLAYLKRYIEISCIQRKDEAAHGRGYSEEDGDAMFVLGVANITSSVLILALYISSEEVVKQYNRPEILWLLSFLMLYWGNRIWIGAKRNKISDDPVVFAIKDNVSRIVGVAFIVVVIAAKYL